MEEQTVRELVCRAGIELVSSGLIARTWGNVSCRGDDKTFYVTPSGRSYETLKPEEIVPCSVEDASWTGNIKPSSEKGIHALVYRTYPDVNFVIHTHQPEASAVSAAGLNAIPTTGFDLLGKEVPVAAYGLPGTKKLRQGVGNALKRCGGRAVILANHGALCFGEDYTQTFRAAQQLENACREYVKSLYLKASGMKEANAKGINDFYVSKMVGTGAQQVKKPLLLLSSKRTESGFIMEDGMVYRFDRKDLPRAAQIHAAIYLSCLDINFINQDAAEDLLAVSLANTPLRPLLDDFVQIVGPSARCAKDARPQEIVRALRGRLSVLVPGGGALCCAATASDAHAVELVMEKDARAQISTFFSGGGRNLKRFDCFLQHFVYTRSYSKKAKSK